MITILFCVLNSCKFVKYKFIKSIKIKYTSMLICCSHTKHAYIAFISGIDFIHLHHFNFVYMNLILSYSKG